jgi:hypothetical protein
VLSKEDAMYIDLTQAIIDLLLQSAHLRQGAQGRAMRPHSDDLYEAAEALKTFVIGQADLRRLNPLQAAILRALLEQSVEWTLIPSHLGWDDAE